MELLTELLALIGAAGLALYVALYKLFLYTLGVLQVVIIIWCLFDNADEPRS